MINWNISSTEIDLARRSLLLWGLIISVVVLLYLGSYTFIEEMNPVEMLESYPVILTKGMGMLPQVFENVNAYHGGMVMLYALLLGSIYSMVLAGGMICRDTDLGSAEFLYTRPVSRTVIMFSKALSFLMVTTVLWVMVYLVSVAVGGFWVSPAEFDLHAQALVHLACLLACLAAGGVAFALAPLFDRTQTTTTAAVVLGLVFFVLNGLPLVYERLAFVRYASIYYYANLAGTAAGQVFHAGMAVLAAVFLLGAAVGAVLLNRREFDL